MLGVEGAAGGGGVGAPVLSQQASTGRVGTTALRRGSLGGTGRTPITL